jgi:SAM-dependent methyltransferase
VLEHTLNDRKVMSNISKILKPGGALLISAPFTYVLHEEPHDYRRYTYYGLSQILRDNGFRIVSSFSMGGTLSSGFLILYYFFMKLFFYSFKMIGIDGLRNNYLIKAVFSFPELVMYKAYAPFFRKKLESNSLPGKNEKFSSTGYFMAAIKES